MRIRAPSKGAVFAMLMLASVAALFLGPRAAAVMRQPFQVILAPLSDVGILANTEVKSAVGNIVSEEISQEEARRLKKDNEELLQLVQSMAGKVEDDSKRLARVQALDKLAFGQVNKVPCELIEARVVAADSLPYGQTRLVSPYGVRYAAPSGVPVTTRRLMTDRSNELQKRFPALAAQWEVNTAALVGRVVSSWAFGAQLQLVTDRGFDKVAANVLRRIDPKSPREITDGSARRTLTEANNRPVPVKVSGDGKSGLVSESIPAEHSIRKGDWLVTRSDDPLLPAQIRIGEVAEVKEEGKSPGFVTLRIKPSADLETLREVYIVVPHGMVQDTQAKGGKAR
ncbi:MAG: rod shape-determining protein MreC [Phycisphaerae bacterium]